MTKKTHHHRNFVFAALAGLLAWQTITATAHAENSAPLDANVFAPAVQTAESMPRLHSLLISHRGQLVVEEYFNGGNARKTANVKSVSKSIMSALVGIAIDRGYIESVDQKITDYYGNYLDGNAPPEKKSITVGHLLSMSAGLETTSFYNYGKWVLSQDWVGFQLRQPVRALPGSRLMYSTGYTHVLSGIVTQASGKSTLQFAREFLARPLGFELNDWPRDPQGIYFGGNNMELTPRQMLAFGEMYMNGGRANGHQVVSAEWVEQSLTPLYTSSRDHERQYGYGWWMRKMGGLDTAFAWGYGGQFILLVPDLELVVVTTSSSQPGDTRRRHIRDLYRLLEGDIVTPAHFVLAHR